MIQILLYCVSNHVFADASVDQVKSAPADDIGYRGQQQARVG